MARETKAEKEAREAAEAAEAATAQDVEQQNAVVTSEPGDEVGVGEPATAEQPSEQDQSGPIVGVEIEDEDGDGLVEVVLAHPITQDRDKDYLGIPRDQQCNVHDKIRVPLGGAQSLINAGYVQVDPEDVEAVQAVLNVQPAATSGNTDK